MMAAIVPTCTVVAPNKAMSTCGVMIQSLYEEKSTLNQSIRLYLIESFVTYST